ncbi:hypothetical protein ACNPNP_05555 [Microbacterium sp. AGC85]
MHPLNSVCCTSAQEPPWWMWLLVGVTALVVMASIIGWAMAVLHDRSAAAFWVRNAVANAGASTDGSYPSAWQNALAVRFRRVGGRSDPPRPESVEEVALWEGIGSRRVDLIYVPAFKLLLPLVALGYLIRGTLTNPGEGWTGSLFQDDSGDLWAFWEAWIGVGIWLLTTAGALALRLSAYPDLRVEDQWIFEHGVAHSLHRTSVDYDDSEVGPRPTYIALDHRLDNRTAAQIYEAFEIWLRAGHMPPSGSEPISSTTLFGAQAEGGYFFLHVPFNEFPDGSAQHRWMLITKPRDGEESVIVTTIPARTDFQKVRDRARHMREKARLRAARRARRDPNLSTSIELVKWEP